MDRGVWWATVHEVARVRHASVTKPPALHHLIAPYKILKPDIVITQREYKAWKN